MSLETSVFAIALIVVVLYLLYFWINSDSLSDEEIVELASCRRFWDAHNYFAFSKTEVEINKHFKSTLNRDGRLYTCIESLGEFPAIASALLKGKKHEWVVFAYCKNKTVGSFYANKGHDNRSVEPNMSIRQIIEIAQAQGAEIVLQFHNHPNAVLSSSDQDRTSADYFGKVFTDIGVTFISFVCGAGQFRQYGWWLADSFYQLDNYLKLIEQNNASSRSTNFGLRKELRRKKSFANARLNGSAHNILPPDKQSFQPELRSAGRIVHQ